MSKKKKVEAIVSIPTFMVAFEVLVVIVIILDEVMNSDHGGAGSSRLITCSYISLSIRSRKRKKNDKLLNAHV